MKDFFVSYNKDDRPWAEWIAWTLEEADYQVVIQAWDFRPGGNFVQDMQQATMQTAKTIAVLSQSYLDAAFTHPEWQAAFAADPKGERRLLIPFRVKPCEPRGLLGVIQYVDLVDLPQDRARLAILGAFSERAKPAEAPTFPGAAAVAAAMVRSMPKEVEFPGEATSSEFTEALVQSTTRGGLSAGPGAVGAERIYSPAELLRLLQKVGGVSPQQFNMLLFALNPPPNRVPTMPAPQLERAQALFEWAVEPGGTSLDQIEELLERLQLPADSTGPGTAPVSVRRFRPAMGGDSISHDRGGAASIGCLVRDRTDPSRLYVLSDFNAICAPNGPSHEGAAVLQPGRLDGGNRASDLFASLARWSRVRDDQAAADQNVSAALAEVIRTSDVAAGIRGFGALTGIGDAKLGQSVRLVGRTSGEVDGEIVQVGAREEVPVSYYQIEGGTRGTGSGSGFHPVLFGDLIVCTPMLQAGDSGAILVDAANRALGLGFAGSTEASIFLPIRRVLDALDVDLVTGDVT